MKRSSQQRDTPKVVDQMLSMWTEDPYLMYLNAQNSKEILHDLLKSSFKTTARSGELVFGQFKIEQIWEQIEHHTSKINTKIMTRIENMIGDEDFLNQIS